MHSHVGGAVICHGVVELRLQMDRINALQVIEEYPSGSVRSDAGPIKVKLFVTVIRSDPNNVALLGDDVDQLELFKETADSGVGLALGHPGFNRDRNVIGRPELETHDRMTNQS